MLRLKGLAVEREGEPAVEKGVVPEHVLDEFEAELEVGAKERGVGGELDQGAVTLVGLGDLGLLLQLALGKLGQLGVAVPEGLGAVGDGKGVDRLLADAVEADRLLEGLAVVLGAGVDDRDAVHELAERDAAAVVAHAHGAVGQLDLDLPPLPHHELVDGVIDGFLEQDVDAVLGVLPVAQAPDVHAGAQSDMVEGAEGLDAGFGIGLGHGESVWRTASRHDAG